METPKAKVGNGIQHEVTKNGKRLRILGTVVLEREDEPNVTASYDYTTSCTNEFFEEDVERLKFFELNKIAFGMTIHRKDDLESSEPTPLKNGVHSNGIKNGSGSPNTTTALKKFSNGTTEPYFTDVIWSRMDMTNPSANPKAYIVKQYYNNKRNRLLAKAQGDHYNNFLCGFVSCLAMILLFWCGLMYNNQNKFDV